MDNYTAAGNAEITTGRNVEIRFGRNIITAVITSEDGSGWKARNLRTGKELTVTRNRIVRILGDAELPAQEPENTPVQAPPPSYNMVAEAIANAERCADRMAAVLPDFAGEPDESDADDVSRKDGLTGTDGMETVADEHDDDDGNAAENAENAGKEHNADTDAASAGERLRKKMSLLEAAYHVLLEERKPLNTKELVKLAAERGLWVQTSCATPEQSLYGAIFREIKMKENSRFRKSETRKGSFELRQ